MERKMEFQPDQESWDSYTERLNCLFTATGINEDEKKVSTLICQNGPALYTVLKELSFPQNPTQMSYNEVLDTLRRHYVGVKSVFYERKLFYSASMEPCETAANWLHRLRSLAVNCDFGKFMEQILVDKFVTGFDQAKVLQRLYEHEGDISLQQALEIAQCNENHLSAEKQSSPGESHNELQTCQRSIQDDPEVADEIASDFVHVRVNITDSDQQEHKYQNHQPNTQKAQPRRDWQTPLCKVLNHFQTLHWQQQRFLQEKQRKLQQQQQQQQRLLKEQQRKLQLTQQQQEQQKRLLQDQQQKLKQQKLQQQQQHQKQQQAQCNVPTCHKCGKKGHSANSCNQKTPSKKNSGSVLQKPVKPKATSSVKK